MKKKNVKSPKSKLVEIKPATKTHKGEVIIAGRQMPHYHGDPVLPRDLTKGLKPKEFREVPAYYLADSLPKGESQSNPLFHGNYMVFISREWNNKLQVLISLERIPDPKCQELDKNSYFKAYAQAFNDNIDKLAAHGLLGKPSGFFICQGDESKITGLMINGEIRPTDFAELHTGLINIFGLLEQKTQEYLSNQKAQA